MSAPALAQEQEDGAIDDNVIIVTAQRQAQSLQEVPVAVSAFDSKALEAQQIENASDLQLTLPNVSFTKSNFTASSFTIRGIGDLCVGVSCDSATAIHLNDSPLFGTRLFETEYFDLERVEVLRGPQGTLFGRNATSGVVNVVTAKPQLGELGASLEGEYGNFNSYKVKGMVNVPVGDTLGFRVAGFYLKRDGYTENLFDNSRIDGRDMYAVRGSIKWEPTPDTTIDLMAYYFREN
ncbi:TonB-dependent receptor plug domain-containing protein, partial [Parasphingorhabdus sp.]